MLIRLEDSAEDVLTKAALGLGLSRTLLAERTGLPIDRVRAQFTLADDPVALQRLAAPLQLSPSALTALAFQRVYPLLSPPAELLAFNTPFPVDGYPEMSVNNFLIRIPGSHSVLAFDSGAAAFPLCNVLHSAHLAIAQLFITHCHRDHCQALPALFKHQPFPAIGFPANEDLHAFFDTADCKADALSGGSVFQFGPLQVTTLSTPGHSPNGLSFLIEGLDRPIAIVGDALFCLSVGGIRHGYCAALKAIRERILSLPAETIVCPGHGPLSTVAFERQHNPFFAA